MSVLSEESRYKILKILESNPEINQRELAKKLGISLGKANYCLKAIIERGWVKAGNFRKNPNKKAYAYYLTAKGLEEKAKVTIRFLQHKQKEYINLQYEIEMLRLEAASILNEKK